jgi:hypothetical protein
MITVTIFINGNPIITRSAVNVGDSDSPATYKVDDGRVIKHTRSRGAVALAIKMLKGVKEI